MDYQEKNQWLAIYFNEMIQMSVRTDATDLGRQTTVNGSGLFLHLQTTYKNDEENIQSSSRHITRKTQEINLIKRGWSIKKKSSGLPFIFIK